MPVLGFDGEAVFLERLNRFVVRLSTGSDTMLCHLHDTGRIDHLAVPGETYALYRAAPRPGRKTGCDVVAFRQPSGGVVVVDSRVANELFKEGYELVLGEGSTIEQEKMILGSRLDFVASTPKGFWAIEVKGVNLSAAGVGLFPNAPSSRAVKHLHTLERLARAGIRSSMVFVALRSDIEKFAPHRRVDRTFASLACSLAGIVEFKGLKTSVEVRGSSIAIKPVGVAPFRCSAANPGEG